MYPSAYKPKYGFAKSIHGAFIEQGLANAPPRFRFRKVRLVNTFGDFSH
jgi:hypothetical protein